MNEDLKMLALDTTGMNPANVIKIEEMKVSIREKAATTGIALNSFSIFYVDGTAKEEILKLLPSNIGKVPISYIGVPLITKQIGVNDCKRLIDKVKAKVHNWKNKMLSYAGRLQLVAFVLASMQVYWESVFILPKTMVKDIDRLPKGFLWCQGDLSRGKAKVAWKLVCRPKNEGCLGIKNLCDGNEGISIWEVKCDNNSRWWDGGIPSDTLQIEDFPNADSKVKISDIIINVLVDRKDKTVRDNKEGNKVKYSVSKMWKDDAVIVRLLYKVLQLPRQST
ncbi:hypothetical protein Tco_0335580 [Tanacetum coccineum]